MYFFFFFFSSRRRHTRCSRDWSSDVCSSDLTGGVGGLFERMFHYFQFRKEEFLGHYHKRSNVESTFSMIKRKFGDSVRSRNDVAMVNEVLCKRSEERRVGKESRSRWSSSG